MKSKISFILINLEGGHATAVCSEHIAVQLYTCIFADGLRRDSVCPDSVIWLTITRIRYRLTNDMLSITISDTQRQCWVNYF